jgi:predicted CDP-diglyceride synthetase/phosphatidate cytidylyltransferase
MFPGIKRWDLILMFALLAAITLFEFLGVASSKMITITQIVKSYVPIPCRLMILAWLNWHFFMSDIVRQLTPK